MMYRLLLVFTLFSSTIIVFGQYEKLILPVGHTQQITDVEYSPDGKYIVTSSIDETIKIWDSNTGRLLNSFVGHKYWVNAVQINQDGSKIVSSGNDETIRVWDVKTGKNINTFYGESIVYANLLASGKSLVSISANGIISIWNTETEELKSTFYQVPAKISSADYSYDRKRLLTGSDAGNLVVWDIAKGEIEKELDSQPSAVNSVKFNADGNMIVASYKNGTIRLLAYPSGKTLLELSNDKSSYRQVVFSPDESMIVAAGADLIYFWDINSGRLVREINGIESEIRSFSIGPSGETIVTASQSKAMIWDVQSRTKLFKLEGYAKSGFSIQFSPDGKTVATASWQESAKLWNAYTGTLIHDLSEHEPPINAVKFSNDGSRLITTDLNGSIKLWNVFDGKVLGEFQGSMFMSSASISPDNKLIATGSKIWNSQTGEILHKLKGHTGLLNAIEFSPSSNYLITASEDNTSNVWQTETGDLIFSLEKHNSGVLSACFSPNERWIATSSKDKTIKIWDAQTGNLIHDIKGHTGMVSSVRFSPDSKKVISSSWDKTVKIWDAQTGDRIKSFDVDDYILESAYFSSDGTQIIAHSSGYKFTFWDSETYEILFNRIQLNDGEWLLYDKYYRYDGSEKARDYLYFSCGLEIIELNQLKDALYVPGLANKIISNQEIPFPKLSDLDICDALPQLEPIENNEYEYYYRISPGKAGIEYVEVYIDKKRVYTFSRDDLIKKDEHYILQIEKSMLEKHFIPRVENEVTIRAIAQKVKTKIQSRGVKALQYFDQPKIKVTPKLYAVMIGVNDYNGDDLDLNYPSKDAMDLSKAIKLSASNLLGEQNVNVYEIVNNSSNKDSFGKPFKQKIREAFEVIGKSAQPQDAIVVFFAGHGMVVGENEKSFMFLTAEASKKEYIGISTQELQNWLSYEGPNRIMANKSIFVFDACHSGMASQELIAQSRGIDKTERIRQVEDLKDKSGMFILAASAPNQSAYELPQYEQGLLTYSLLHTIKNNPEVLDEGKYLNVQKWFLESEEYLQHLVRKMGYQQDAQPYGTANIRIGEVNEEVKNSIALAKEKPVLFCANVLNGATFSDDLKLKSKVNNHLDEVTKRGSESDFVYSRVESPSANLINIIYQTDGEKVTCQVKLIKGEEQLFQKTISGSKGELHKLVSNIIEEVAGFAE